MILSIGEILFDIFPDYRRIGGAPFNFAYHMGALGFPTRFISRVGEDENGREILRFLREQNFNTDLIQTDPDHITGEVQVSLNGKGSPTFDIVRDVAYDHITLDHRVEEALAEAELIYYGTLVQRTDHGHRQVDGMLRRRGGKSRCLCDVNLRPDCYNQTVVRASMEHCDILKLSNEELPLVREMLGLPGAEAAFIEAAMKRYGLLRVALTSGAEGSRLYSPRGYVDARPSPGPAVVDTVGAGDGFTALLAAGCLKGWAPERILETATRFAGRICTIQGAIPEDPSFYDDFRNML